LAATVPAFAWVDHPRVQHDVWKMRCFPTNNVPFVVTTNDKAGGLLIIYGKNGQARINEIESTEDTDYGFMVIANGSDFKGKHREIELHVSTSGRSHLAVNRDTDHMIDCDDARSAD